MCGAAANSAVRIFLFRKFSNFFKNRTAFFIISRVFIDIWIPHRLKMAVYHRILHKYFNWKKNAKYTFSF